MQYEQKQHRMGTPWEWRTISFDVTNATCSQRAARYSGNLFCSTVRHIADPNRCRDYLGKDVPPLCAIWQSHKNCRDRTRKWRQLTGRLIVPTYLNFLVSVRMWLFCTFHWCQLLMSDIWQAMTLKLLFFLPAYRASWYCQSLYLPTDAQESCFKGMLKFTLKQLLHVAVQSPSSGSALFELAKVIVIKIIS